MNTDEKNITTGESPKNKELLWLIGCFAVTAVAAFLRFWQLELKPLHHDEGVNGFFLITLFREGVYKYDPANYHGPDLYYIALAATKMFGLNTVSIRGSVAIFGVLTVVFAFFLKNYIGKIGSLAAALFIALSPGMVYISRYFIHEILFVFFSFGIVLSVLYFIEKRKAGVFAIAAMTLLLLVCFLPTALNLANLFGTENSLMVWAVRLALFAIEAILVFLIMRMILAWNDGRPIYLLLASASAVLLFATKETAFITIGTMLAAVVCVWMWRKINSAAVFEKNKFWFFVSAHFVLVIWGLIYYGKVLEAWTWLYDNFLREGKVREKFIFYSIIFLVILSFLAWILFLLGLWKNGNNTTNLSEPIELTWTTFRSRLGNSTDLLLISVAVVFVFAYVGILFFSSFFTYPEGIKKAFEAYAIWTKTGSKDHTQNGTLAYFKWLFKIESPILILSAVGTLIALLKARHRFAIFAGFWAFGLFAAYTIIPYKTPWLALSFTLPMCIVAGYGINELTASRDIIVKILGWFLMITAVGILGYQTYDLNFLRYDDDSMPYVYAHTKRGFLDLIRKIEYYADKSGKGKDASIEIISPDYWSMPWYMREYPKAIFHGKPINANASEMIVAEVPKPREEVPNVPQREELIERYAAHYKYAGTYPLRPGVELYLLVRRDLADEDASEISEISGKTP